jgi:glutamine amidotransferase PdxT
MIMLAVSWWATQRAETFGAIDMTVRGNAFRRQATRSKAT